MSSASALDYYNKLSGLNLDVVDIERLSSAHRARFIAWCSEHEVSSYDFQVTSEVTALRQASNTLNALNQSMTPSKVGGVGVDIQNIGVFLSPGIEDFKANTEVLSLFTKKEIVYAECQSNPYETLAGIFCAKEAIYKATGSSEGPNWLSIEISHMDGKPVHSGYSISISHDGEYAVAMAVSGINISETAMILSEKESKNKVKEVEEKVELSRYTGDSKSNLKTIFLSVALSIAVTVVLIEVLVGGVTRFIGV